MPDGPSSLPLFDNIERPEPDDAPTVRVTAASDETIAARPLLEPPAPIGSGRLVRCAWPLLSLLAQIVAGTSVSDPEQLKSGAAALIHQFERVALADGVNAREVNAARYVLCTAIDEAVLTSPRGGSSEWKNASLLSMFHNETWGGEKLFTLIDRALQDSQQYGDLLELCHFVLLLGFQGKFRLERDGSAQVDALRRRLFDVLRPRFGTPTPVPVPQPEQIGRRARLIHYVPVWVVGAVCLLLAAILLGWFGYRLQTDAARVAEQIDALSLPVGASQTGGMEKR